MPESGHSFRNLVAGMPVRDDRQGNGMSEGAGFVNTALLEEEHDQPWSWPVNDGFLDR